MDPDLLDSIDSGDDLADAPESAAPDSPAPDPAPERAPDTAPPAESAPERVTRTIAPAPAGLPIIDPTQRPAPQAEAAPQEGARVPLASLLEERAQWKRENEALQSRLAALEAKNAAPPAPPAEPPPPAPEFIDDPKGYVDAQVQAAIQKLEQTNNRTEQQQAELAELRLASAVKVAEADASARIPDWQGALAHLRGVRYQELKLMFPDATDEQVVATITNEERQVAAQELSRGRNPYDFAFQLAKLRGYTPAATTAAPAPAPAPGSAPTLPKSTGGPQTLDPSVTLNQVGGAPADDADTDPDDDGELLETAKAERFGRRKAS